MIISYLTVVMTMNDWVQTTELELRLDLEIDLEHAGF